MLLLSKRLENQAIQIAAANVQHGGKAAGLTVPSVQAQASVLERVYSSAKITAPSYIECHGTATQLGDPIEFAALVKCFKDREREAMRGERPVNPGVVLGAVKSLIGHLESCAGMAGLIKLALSMRFQCMAPIMHFTSINKSIPIVGSRFSIANEVITWETKNAVGGVSSFGMGGVNAHVALRSLSSSVKEERCGGCGAPSHRVVLSAEQGVLSKMTASFAQYLVETPEAQLCTIASSLGARSAFPESVSVVAMNVKDLRVKLLGKGGSSDSSSALSHCTHTHRSTGLPKYAFRQATLWFRTRSDDQSPTVAATKLTWRLMESMFFLRDHVVQGSVILPGVFYLELARKTWKSSISSTTSLQNISWHAPSVPSSGILDMEVHVGDGGKVEMFVRDRMVFSCVVSDTAASSSWTWPQDVVPDWTVSKPEVYAKLKGHGLAYGSSLNGIERFGWSGKFGFSLLRKGDLGADLVLHPTLLDGAFQTVVLHHMAAHDNGSLQFLPFSLERIVWSLQNDTLPDQCLVLVEDQSANTAQSLRYEIHIVDARSYRLLVEFCGFVRRPNSMVKQQAVAAPREVANRPSVYVDFWKPAKTDPPVAGGSGRLLVLCDEECSDGWDAGLFESISFVVLGGRELTRSLFDAMLAEYKDRLDLIVVAWKDLSVLPVFRMVQAMLSLHLNVAVARLFEGKFEGERKCLASMVGGLGRTLVYESPLMPLVSLWLEDESVSRSTACLGVLSAESHELLEVRYVQGVRVDRGLEEARVLESSGFAFGRSKLYLISGGAGGIGLVLAKHLGQSYGAHIVLIGRRPSMPEDVLEELRSHCASAMYYSADACNLLELQRVIPADVIAKVNGVIHCAGLIRDAFLLNKSEADFEAVLKPKLEGCRNLDVLTRGSPVEFFVVCSSIAALLPNQGQADYASANSFMDAFVLERKGPGHSLSIGWSLWADGGMQVTKEEKDHLEKVFGIHPLETRLALVGFEELVKSKVSHAIIASPNARIQAGTARKKKQDDQHEVHQASAVDLKKIISAVLIDELMLQPDELKEDTSFSSLGLSSMVISSINSRLEEHLGPISKTLFFEYDNLREVLAHFDRLASRGRKGKRRPAPTSGSAAAASRLLLTSVEEKRAVCVLRPQDFHVHGFFIGGRKSVPGGCFLELAMEAGSALFGSTIMSVRDNFWPNPMFMATDESVETSMQVVFTERDSSRNFVVTSGAGIVHATGSLGSVDDDLQSELDLRSWVGSTPLRTLGSDEFYATIEANAELHLEGRFRLIQELREFDSVAVSRYELSADMEMGYQLHPVVVTGVEQTLLVFTALKYKPLIPEELRLMPVAIELAGASQPVPQSGWIVLSSLTTVAASNLLHKVDAFVLDDARNVVACVKGNAMRIQRGDAPVAVDVPLVSPSSSSSAAILSRAVRVSEAWNMQQLTEALESSREMIVPVTVDRWDSKQGKNLPKEACIFSGLSMFDGALFSISPKEAAVMDPQHRMVLECSWEVLFDALDEDKNIGVYIGIGKPEYAVRAAILGIQSSHFETGNCTGRKNSKVSCFKKKLNREFWCCWSRQLHV